MSGKSGFFKSLRHWLGGGGREHAAASQMADKSNGNGPNKLSLDEMFVEIEQAIDSWLWNQESFISQLAAAYKRGYMVEPDGWRNVILVAGPAGTGKETALNVLVQKLHEYGMTGSDEWIMLDLSMYRDHYAAAHFLIDASAAFERGEGTVVFEGLQAADPSVLNIVESLITYSGFRTTEGAVISAANHFLVFYIDFPLAETSAADRIPPPLAAVLPAFLVSAVRYAAYTSPLGMSALKPMAKSRLDRVAELLAAHAQVKVVTEPEVIHPLAKMAVECERYGEALDQWISSDLYSQLLDLRARDQLTAGDTVTLTYKWVTRQFRLESSGLNVPLQLTSVDRKEKLEDVLQELEALIGIKPVKRFVHEWLQSSKIHQRRAAENKSPFVMSMHMVFTGNPGTGKTTVARLIARILKSMNLLSRGHLVEVGRHDLVCSSVGGTASKTMAKVREALGGVLFIDEAYTLARYRNNYDFEIEAIDALVKAMEDHRGNLVVIAAGYTKEMESFLGSNPGLRSRFPFIVEFPDFTGEQMFDVLRHMASEKEYAVESEARPALIELFERGQIPGRNDNGNARLVRNLFEEAARKQMARRGDRPAPMLTAADFGVDAELSFQLEKEFASIFGMHTVKSFLRTLEKQIIVDARRKKAGISASSVQSLNMIFSGNPGTGKTMTARLVAKMLQSLGMLKKGQLVEVDRSQLVAEYMGQTAVKTTSVVQSALGGVLFIDEAYSLVREDRDYFGKEAVDTLVRLVDLHKDHLVVILAGYTDEMRDLMRTNPGLASRFPLHIEFPDYAPEDMVRITELMAMDRGFRLTGDLVGQLLAPYYESRQITGKNSEGNGRLVRNTLERAIRNQANRLAEQTDVANEALTELNAADFDLLPREQAVNALDELNELIGLEPVKHVVRSLSAQVEVAALRRKLGLPGLHAQSLHMVFIGSPGTGKTTVARIVARRLHELGLAKTDVLVETDRSGLVAGYVGQTALKTRETIERALGGVLFIDEAYSLAAESGRDFGSEAVDTLVKALDDYRDSLIVILAGYSDEMERFLDMNPGLRSRVPNVVHFPDYTLDEKMRIAKAALAKQGYRCSAEAESALEAALAESEERADIGNGRLVRNLCEQAIRSLALRVSGNPGAGVNELSVLRPEDFGVTASGQRRSSDSAKPNDDPQQPRA